MDANETSFRTVNCTSNSRRPLDVMTATNVGLLPKVASGRVPDLVPELLPTSAYSCCFQFLYRWLLCPPSASDANALRCVLQGISKLPHNASFPVVRPVPLGKLVSLLIKKQGNAKLFHDLRNVCTSVIELLKPAGFPSESVIDALWQLALKESGLSISASDCLIDLCDVVQLIDSLLPREHEQVADALVESFFERNEIRGMVRYDNAIVRHSYKALQDAKAVLFAEMNIVPGKWLHDVVNNTLYLKSKPFEDGVINVTDRRGFVITKAYTTVGVRDALREYLSASKAVERDVLHALQMLSMNLATRLSSMIVAMHFSVIANTCLNLSVEARRKNWTVGQMGSAIAFEGLTPYWMDHGVANDVSLNRFILLTAPNMSGKSTLMRSICSAVLLAMSGLYAPACKAIVPVDLDGLFLRMVGGDSPVDNQSAFAVEVEGIRSVMDQATANSLILIDEFGRGTSSQDGVALAGAVMEQLVNKRSSCIFATHLHELQHLPLRANPNFWRMKTTIKKQYIRWSYQVEEGICRDSFGLHCALRCGLQSEIVRRAFELQGKTFDGMELQQQVTSSCLVADILREILGDTVALVRDCSSLVPALASAPVVYILQSDAWVYVGQSQNLGRRLSAHRSRFRGVPFKCYACPVETQAIALQKEKIVIQTMLKEGVVLLSDHDGNSHRVKENIGS